MTTRQVMQQALDALDAMKNAMLDQGVNTDPAHPNRQALNYGVTAMRKLHAALAQPQAQPEPVTGDLLPAIGSRVWIRHGRDDDAHACTVTDYYAWGDLNGDKHLHRIFVRMVYEGTTCQQARMLCDCFATEHDALVGGQPPIAQPAKEQRRDLLFSTVKMQERHDAFVARAVQGLEEIKQAHQQEKSCATCNNFDQWEPK